MVAFCLVSILMVVNPGPPGRETEIRNNDAFAEESPKKKNVDW